MKNYEKNPFEAHLYRLENYEYHKKSIKLIQTDVNHFRVIEFGIFKPILEPLLFESELANLIFKSVPSQIEYFQRITIHRMATNENWTNYYQIIFKNNLGLDSFKNAKNDGLRIYSFMYDSVYVSDELKKNIETEYSKIKDVEFINEEPLIC